MSFCHDVSDVGMANIFCCVGNITVLIFQESWRRYISSVMCHYTDKAQRNIPTSLTERVRLRDVTPSSSSHERFPLTSAFESVAFRSEVGVALCSAAIKPGLVKLSCLTFQIFLFYETETNALHETVSPCDLLLTHGQLHK